MPVMRVTTMPVLGNKLPSDGACCKIHCPHEYLAR